ncbi:HAMP domain-containing histidine kinase [Reichenbachiella agarivorans]|uniref:histidine kinase n=1 Tax=Reichenbachiella agarivorans TaxID=2979464 RepID=A0ABY6CNH7_9BACT|nr:HAMP domain-containing sensor histidine kinase [Reichenbachiella agarivorans]UXP32073.1 HAMP domain-containing histidine kinase [Reichenbachiella agarivorans]
MSNLSDQQLLDELNLRFEEKNRLLDEQKQFMADLKTVNEKLLQSEKLKSHFLSNIKNEINNPMTSIMGLLRMNLSDSVTTESAQKNTRLIYREASVLNFQMQNLFMAAELEAGVAYIDLKKFRCAEVVAEAISHVQSQMGDHQIDCVMDADVNQTILSDRNKLLVILSNLISNAHKFCDASSGRVTVALNKMEDHLLFLVSDNGVGISDEDRANIYDRFNQLDAGTTKNYGGHGLGLSIVHSLVDLLDGTMKIESQIGKGTVVSVILPIENASDVSPLFEEDFELFSDTNEEIF